MDLRKIKTHWLFGCLYLLCVPVFAVIYSFFSDDFYQATIEPEGILQQHEDQIADWFVRVVEGKAVLNLAMLDGSGCDDKELEQARIDIHADPVFIVTDDLKRIKDTYGDITTKAECGDYAVQLWLGDVNADILYGRQRVLSFMPFRPSILFPEKYTEENMTVFDHVKSPSTLCDEIKNIYPDLVYSKGACQLLVGEELSEEFKYLQDQYNKALQGKVTDISKFSRMLYFSTTTITTLGYGDIVPLTTRTRLLVALESILGIILIGLFLNSLVSSRSV